MSLLSAILLAAAAIASASDASLSSPVVSDPHGYFTTMIHRAVDDADAISPQAIAYPGQYPSINIHPWVDPASHTHEERQEVLNQVLAEALGAGSFNVVGHGVSEELLDRLENSTDRFFSQSLEFKRNYTKHGLHGYTANQVEKFGSNVYKTDNPMELEGDLREIYAMTYPPSSDNVQGPQYFQNDLDEFIEKLQPVELALNNLFSAALGIAKGVELPLTFLQDADGGAGGFLRAHRYPAMPSEYDDAARFLPHSDFSTVTLIYGSEKGLEEIRDGRWMEVPINRGELHVTIGEVMNMLSNGLFANNVHRVSSAAAKDRISFGYFFAQGRTGVESNEGGVEPVCAAGEEAQFSPTSTKMHIGKYMSMQKVNLPGLS